MTKISKRILNRVEINIIENDDNTTYKIFQDWLKLSQMKEDVNIMPNEVEFDFIPGYTFYGLKLKQDIGESNNPLSVTFECDYWKEK